MKTCSKCKEVKDLSNYHKDSQKKDGLYSSCKSCMSKEYTSERYKKVRKHPRYYTIKRNFKIKKYGLTNEEHDLMLKSQDNRCAICNIHQDCLNKVLSIDHNHNTGKVRGLLCNNCNFGLGYFSDNPENLKKAIEYVIKNS